MSSDQTPVIDSTLPPIVQRFLASGYRLESIKLDAAGRWWHRDEPIEHAKIVDLFSRSIDRTEGGTWILHIAPYTYPIEVVATPFFVTHMEAAPGGGFSATLNNGETQHVMAEDMRVVEDGGFHIPTADPRFEARLMRGVYMRFVEVFVEEDPAHGFVIRDGERRVPVSTDDV